MQATPSKIVKISRQAGLWENRARAGGVFIGFLALKILVLDAGESSAQEQGFSGAVHSDESGF